MVSPRAFATAAILSRTAESTTRRTTVTADRADLDTLAAEAELRGVPLTAVLHEAVAEKAARLRERHRPSVGVWRSGDGLSAAELAAEPIAEPPR